MTPSHSQPSQQDRLVDQTEFLQAVANTAAHLQKGEYDPAQLHLLITLLKRFAQGVPFGVTSVEVNELEQIREYREQLAYLAKRKDLYSRIKNQRITVRQFVKEYLGSEDAVLSRFLLGLYSNLQVFDLLQKTKDEILGTSVASQEFATDEESLDRMEAVLDRKFGLTFELPPSRITSLCEMQHRHCDEMLNIGRSFLVPVPGLVPCRK